MHFHNLLLPAALLHQVYSATVTITQSAAPAPTSPSYTNPQTFQSQVLAAHNFFRMDHNASALTWNTTSASFALNWAKPCDFKHSGGPAGENLAAGYANASAAVDAWGLERQSYDFNKPGFGEGTGHFTQLVWSNTTSVGCGVVSCQGKNQTPGFYVVCEYYPPGNIVGNNNQFFRDNVKKQIKGKASDTAESGIDGKGEGSITSSTTAPVSTSTRASGAGERFGGERSGLGGVGVCAALMGLWLL